jgi:tetratricopeptide (TPR) repeat protein
MSPRLSVPVAPAERSVELVELHVSAEVSGALAVTTWELVFHNPNGRILEGQLEFPLLDAQTVIRFAMDIDGALREAVPVPKDKGRQVFEDIVRRGVDPGLLERTAGNSYRARVYPLLPGQTKRVVIAYQEELAGEAGAAVYRLALDLPRLRRFTLELAVRGEAAQPTIARDSIGLSLPPWQKDHVVKVEKADFAASGLLELALPPAERPAVTVQAFAGKTYFRAEQAIAPRTRPRARPKVLGLLWDCSGSAAGRDLKREYAALERYFAALGEVEVRLVRLRDAAEPGEAFQVRGGDWAALRRALDATMWDGATALSTWQPEPGVDAWLLISDGLVNFGALDARPDTRGAPLHTMSSARRADPGRLKGLADANGGEFVDLLALPIEVAVQRLLNETERLLALETSPREVAQVYPEAPAPLRGEKVVLAGILRGEAATVRARVGFADEPATARTIEVEVRGDEPRGQLAARAWAALKIASLEPLYAINRADIERTGQEFGIVTRETSLIILETLEDYVRYDIAPPEPLRAAWDRQRGQRWRAAESSRQGRIERVVALFREYVAWWEKDFAPAPEKPPLKAKRLQRSGGWDAGPEMERGITLGGSAGPRAESREADVDRYLGDDESREVQGMPAPAPMAASEVAMPAAEPMMDAMPMDGVAAEAFEQEEAAAPAEEAAKRMKEEGGGHDKRASIQLQRWTPDAPYLERMRRTPDDRLYHVYLEEAIDHARSTAFFLDVADVFFERKMPALALRALSNLAEMELENPAVLRILGYRLLQAGRADLARPVFAQVLELRPEEPQSYRDLAQACAAIGEVQAAIELLWEVVAGEWDGRFPEIELVALIELNALIATSAAPLDLAKIDPRLRRALPLDLRVVLTWDADNTDIDLWVTDPSGEKAYYGNRLTKQGGRMSPDFRQGYGPEEFSLKKARPGEYLVEANFYGNTQQIVAGATTIQLQFITGFATTGAQDQRVTLRLRDTREVVTVGRFTVG